MAFGSALCVRELRLILKFARERTFGRDRPHFDLHAVRQAGAFPRDRYRVVEARDVEQKIAADRFLRFCKWPVRYHAVFALYDLAFGFERVPSDGFVLIRQPFEPGHPLICYFLFFLGRETLGPIVSAKQQHVSILILCVHIL